MNARTSTGSETSVRCRAGQNRTAQQDSRTTGRLCAHKNKRLRAYTGIAFRLQPMHHQGTRASAAAHGCRHPSQHACTQQAHGYRHPSQHACTQQAWATASAPQGHAVLLASGCLLAPPWPQQWPTKACMVCMPARASLPCRTEQAARAARPTNCDQESAATGFDGRLVEAGHSVLHTRAPAHAPAPPSST